MKCHKTGPRMISMRNVLKSSAVFLLSFSLFRADRCPKAAPAAAPNAAARRAISRWRASQGLVKPISSACSATTQPPGQGGRHHPLPIPDIYDVAASFLHPGGPAAGHWYVSGILSTPSPATLSLRRRSLARCARNSPSPPSVPVGRRTPRLIVEFADWSVPPAATAPLMAKLHDDFPEARFVFQSFPLPQLHPWAVRPPPTWIVLPVPARSGLQLHQASSTTRRISNHGA